MFRRVLFSTVAVVAGFSVAAQAAPKDEVTDAAKKLGEAKSYSWKSDTQFQGGFGGGGGGGQGRGRFGGPTEGKIEKDGFAHLSMQRGDNTVEAVVKGDKGAVKTQDGWQSLAELQAQLAADGGQGGQGRGRGGFTRQLQNFKAPAQEAQDLASKTKEITKDGDAYTGELTEEAAKELMAFRGGGQGGQGGNAPQATDAKGTVKFWVKDGALAKYEYNVKGKREIQGNPVEIDRTTTVEIKDVDSTKVEIPEEAKSKLG